VNTITKKTLVVTTLIGINFVLALAFPLYFGFSAIALALLIVIAWKYFFEVSLSIKAFKEKSKFLVLPLIFNLGALYLTTVFFQTFAKATLAIAVIMANYFLWIALRKVHNLSERAAIFHRNILIVISFVSVFLGSAAIFRIYMLFSTSQARYLYQALLVAFIFGLFYVISTFLTWENGGDDDLVKLRPYNVVNSLLGAEIAWVASIWIVNYPVIAISEKANLGGTPLPAILLTIVFYFLWGVIFHKLDGSLTRRVLTEYIFITLIFIAVLLVTARWLPVF